MKAVKIGNNTLINRNCQFHIGGKYPSAKCIIEDNVYVGMNTTFVCVSHEIGTKNQRAGKNIFSDIYVGRGTWIGVNVTVLPGVTIGQGCVIAAGAVATSDCDDNYLYAGVSAKKKRFLGE